MSARACTDCGASASEDAEHCEACGSRLEPRLLHEGSDVRVEPERVGAALLSEAPAPNGRWARVSDHPGEPPSFDRNHAQLHELERSLSPTPEAMPGSQETPKTETTDIAVAPATEAAPTRPVTGSHAAFSGAFQTVGG